MCGLYGIKSKYKNAQHVKALKGLGVIMSERGTDSTGIALIDKKVELVKDIVSSVDFFDGLYIEPINTILGHTRLATVGAITISNSHPYIYGDVVGCHNGSVNNYSSIGQYKVDSMVIFDLLNKYKNDFVKVFNKLNGSMAVTWNYRNKTYLVRHNNPLYIHVDKNYIYWCSTKEALTSICLTLGVKPNIKSLKEDIVYEIDNNLNIRKYKVEFKQTHYYGGNYGHGYGYNSGYDYDKEFVTNEARHWVKSEGCLKCHKTIDNKNEAFWTDYETLDTFCVNCFKSPSMGNKKYYNRSSKEGYIYVSKK